jgi:hypothetical protein
MSATTATLHTHPGAHSPAGAPHVTANGHKPLPGSLIEFVMRRRFASHSEFVRATHAIGPAHGGGSGRAGEPQAMVDFLFLDAEDAHDPETVFDRLRWGGQVIYVSRDRKKVEAAAEEYATWRVEAGERGAWVLEQRVGVEKKYLLNLRFLGWRTPVYFMVARKVMLVPPGKSSDRFTYNVYLEKNRETGHYEVVKEVPTIERVLARLREKFPDADEETLRRRARKFTEKIFPVFLTRETAILRLLHRDLPKAFRNKVPRVLAAENDDQGYIRTLRLKWLRNRRRPVDGHTGDHGRPLTQLEFAHQSAELLSALHDIVGVMHLDLRLDNFVITENGVGFVDFGSAVRVGEDFPESSLLCNLFEEMMKTSQIQRMLGKMTQSGQVTSEEIRNCYQRIDKAVDFFYLAVQINAPLTNPDFHGLVEFDPQSAEAAELSTLTEQILRPSDTQNARFKSASEILLGIDEVRRRLGQG